MATHDHDEVRPYASPVCYAHEFETNPLQTAEVIAFLNGLLEGERAGAQGLVDMSKTCTDAALKQLLLDVARDEGRYCVMLRSHVQRLGGTPTAVTGVFGSVTGRVAPDPAPFFVTTRLTMVCFPPGSMT